MAWRWLHVAGVYDELVHKRSHGNVFNQYRRIKQGFRYSGSTFGCSCQTRNCRRNFKSLSLSSHSEIPSHRHPDVPIALSDVGLISLAPDACLGITLFAKAFQCLTLKAKESTAAAYTSDVIFTCLTSFKLCPISKPTSTEP